MAGKSVNNAPSTVRKALDMIEAFAEAGRPLGVTEISRRLKAHKSTAYRILQALRQKGYIRQDPVTEKYSLGFKILRIGAGLLEQVSFREIGKEVLKTLGQETSQTARLAVLEGTEVVYIEHVDGKDPLRLHLQIGSRGPVYCTAAGKAILAFLPERERDEILSQCEFRVLTAKTIDHRSKFLKELEAVRKNGFSVSNEEFREGIRAAGAPIFDMQGRVVGAIVMVAPAFRLRTRDFPLFGQQVKKAAMEISRKMGCPAFPH
ncbi:MAG TPA: IclR family transcriptional regulator [Thermodesulfobacteriota bacterium]|nr:IclR family transcriptional regulator [Thermodesulfobacteriota bacterium]